MKKWLTIGFVILALLLLAARALYIHVDSAENERPHYVKALGFRFSASVDSMKVFSRTNGLIYFHATAGELNLSTEDRVNQKLKFNASLRFILPVAGKLAFHSRDLTNYHLHDSLVINTDVDKIFIFRHGRRAAQSELSKALSRRFF